MRVIIIGAGPAGIAAAHRLDELSERNWHLYEAADTAGGRARPVRSNGFTYDMGHRIDVRHPYIEEMLRNTLGDSLAPTRVRDAMVIEGSVVAMPLQQNLRALEPSLLVDCIMGLARMRERPPQAPHLQAWVRASFGDGLGRRVMEPYLRKHWAHPLDLMDAAWAPDKMPLIDLETILRAIVGDERVAAGAAPTPSEPTRVYPAQGTAEPLQRTAERLARQMSFGSRVAQVDPRTGTIRLANGLEDHFDVLVSTMPLAELLPITLGVPVRVRSAALQLASSAAPMLGIGFGGALDLPAERLHFAAREVPFSRVTHLSALSPAMTPGEGYSSIVVEASASNWDAPPPLGAPDVMAALAHQNVLSEEAASRIIDVTPFEIACARPTPTIDRDVALELIQPYLMSERIFSRGLSGSWMHEAGDLDRSMMQGIEVIDHVLLGTPERTWPEPAARPAARMAALELRPMEALR